MAKKEIIKAIVNFQFEPRLSGYNCFSSSDWLDVDTLQIKVSLGEALCC